MIGPRTVVLFGVCVALVVSAVACSGAVRAADGGTVTVDSGGHRREYIVHMPAHPPAGRLAAVLLFHGGGGTAHGMRGQTGFDRLADENGFVTVYPQGEDRSWSDSRGADTRAGAAGIDDIGFVSAIIDRLIADDDVDPARVYATGISNGGIFTEDLGCRLAGRIAAIAPVAGPISQPGAAACAPDRPMPVLEIHGSTDPIVPYQGGPVRVTSGNLGGAGTVAVLSVDATQQLWRDRDGCVGSPASTALPDTAHDGTSVTVVAADDCRDGSRVQLYSVTGGGHTWPGGAQYLPKAVIGAVSRQFDAAGLIWQFFSGFRR